MKSKLILFFLFFIFTSCDRERQIDWERRGGQELAKGRLSEKPSSATDNEPLELRYVNLDYISPSVLEGTVELEVRKDYYQHDTEDYGFVTYIGLNFQLHKGGFIVDLQKNKDVGTWMCKQASQMLVHPFECKSFSLFFNLKKFDKKIKLDRAVTVSIKFQDVFEGELQHPELSERVPLKGYKYQVQQTLRLPRIIKDKPLMTFLKISKMAFENEKFYNQKEYEIKFPFRE